MAPHTHTPDPSSEGFSTDPRRGPATAPPEPVGTALCSYENPYAGDRCRLPAIPGEDPSLCVLHSQRIDKKPDDFVAAVRRKFEMEDYTFDGCLFPSPMDFRSIEFTTPVSFCDTVFVRGATFAGCRFQGRQTLFSQATFMGIGADFSDATFGGAELRFDGARFEGERTRFDRCRFDTPQSTFESAIFQSDETNFSQAIFASERLSFNHIDVMSPWVLFEGARQNSGTLLFLRATVRGKMISFEEFQQHGGVLNMQAARLKAGTVSFAGALFGGETVRLEGTQFETERLSWERVNWKTEKGANLRKAHIRSKEVTFAGSRSESKGMDFQGSHIEAERLSFDGCQWTGSTGFEESRWRVHDISFQDASFAGDILSFDGSHIRAKSLRFNKAKSVCDRTGFSGVKLDVKSCDWSDFLIESHQFSAQGLQWKGRHFLMDRMLCRTRKAALNRSRFEGGLLSFAKAKFVTHELSLTDTLFLTEEVCTDGLQVGPGTLRMGAEIGPFRFQGIDCEEIDFSGSVWPLTSRFGRPICTDELKAETREELDGVAEFYQYVAKHYDRESGPHAPEDFLAASLDCGRLHADWFGDPWSRLRMEWCRLAAGYGTAPWRSLWIWLGVALLAAVVGAACGWSHLILLWPLSLSGLGGLAEYFTSLETIGFPKAGLSFDPAVLWGQGFLGFLTGLLTTACGITSLYTVGYQRLKQQVRLFRMKYPYREVQVRCASSDEEVTE